MGSQRVRYDLATKQYKSSHLLTPASPSILPPALTPLVTTSCSLCLWLLFYDRFICNNRFYISIKRQQILTTHIYTFSGLDIFNYKKRDSLISFITQIFKEPLVLELDLWPLILLTNDVNLNTHCRLLVLFCFSVPCSWHSTETLLNGAWYLFLERKRIKCNIWVFQVWYEGLRRAVQQPWLSIRDFLRSSEYASWEWHEVFHLESCLMLVAWLGLLWRKGQAPAEILLKWLWGSNFLSVKGLSSWCLSARDAEQTQKLASSPKALCHE